MSTDAPARRQAPDKCWSRIGVWSPDGASCPELKRFVHCRNCNHYSAAGRRMLERTMPRDYRREWTERYAQEQRVAEKTNHSVLVFRLGDEWLALESRYVKEITQTRKIHSLPHRSDKLVKGLINIRGELKLCISIGTLLKLEKARDSYTTDHEILERMILIESEQQSFIFPVSEVHGILHYTDHELQSLPATLANTRNKFSRGIVAWNARHVGIIDHELLFYALGRGLQ